MSDGSRAGAAKKIVKWSRRASSRCRPRSRASGECDRGESDDLQAAIPLVKKSITDFPVQFGKLSRLMNSPHAHSGSLPPRGRTVRFGRPSAALGRAMTVPAGRIAFRHPVIVRAFALAEQRSALPKLCGDWEVAPEVTGLIPHPHLPEMAGVPVHRGLPSCRRGRRTPHLRDHACRRRVGWWGRWALRHEMDSFGYWVGQPFWGNGYATAAARRIIALAFSRLDIDAPPGDPSRTEVRRRSCFCEVRNVRAAARDASASRVRPAEEFLVWSIGRDAWDRARDAHTALIARLPSEHSRRRVFREPPSAAWKAI